MNQIILMKRFFLIDSNANLYNASFAIIYSTQNQSELLRDDNCIGEHDWNIIMHIINLQIMEICSFIS